MMSKLCANDVTPLDEHTFLYEEELILGRIMEKKGWKTVYNPCSVVYHKHESSTGGIRKNAFAYMCQVCSEIYYCKRYIGVKNVTIYPLVCYRTVLYIARMFRIKMFRQYWKCYIGTVVREMKKTWKKY